MSTQENDPERAYVVTARRAAAILKAPADVKFKASWIMLDELTLAASLLLLDSDAASANRLLDVMSTCALILGELDVQFNSNGTAVIA